MTDLFNSADLGPMAQVILGLATLVNSMLLWPIVKKLKANDETHDERLSQLERPKRRRKRRSPQSARPISPRRNVRKVRK